MCQVVYILRIEVLVGESEQSLSLGEGGFGWSTLGGDSRSFVQVLKSWKGKMYGGVTSRLRVGHGLEEVDAEKEQVEQRPDPVSLREVTIGAEGIGMEKLISTTEIIVTLALRCQIRRQDTKHFRTQIK